MNRIRDRFPTAVKARALLLLLTLPLLHCEPPAAELAPVALTLSPANPRMAQSTGQSFTVRAGFADGHSQQVAEKVQWSVVDEQGRAVAATFPLPGLIAIDQPGHFRVRATLGGQVSETQLEVTAATLKSVAISPTAPAIALGTGQQFTLTGAFSDGTTQDVTALSAWSVKNLVGTGVAVMDSSGLCTSKAPGKVTVSGKYKTKTASTTLEVTPAVVTLLSVSPASPSIAKGTTLQFNASAVFSDGTTQNVSTLAAWSVQDVVGTGVAAIDPSGSALGRNVGQVIVSAEYSGQLASTTMTVTPATPNRITVTPGAVSLAKGTSQSFTATAAFTDGSTQDVTLMAAWTTTDLSGTGIATVDARGIVTGKSVGSAAINAAFSGLSSSAVVTVTPALITSLLINPTTATIGRGTTRQFVASGTYSDGSIQDLSAVCTWSIADVIGTGVASINARGLATGKAEGTAAITATYLTVTASATLVVIAPTVLTLGLNPGSATVGKGGSQQFKAVALLSDFTLQDVSAVAVWSTTDISGTGVASVDGTGLATAKALGTAGISAAYRGLSATATLTVSAGFGIIPVPTTQTLWGIWGNSASNVWAVGVGGTVLHFDGTTWTLPTATAGTTTVNAVWGNSASDVWMGGASGLIIHWDGSSFTGSTIGSSSIYGLWGAGVGNVWAATAGGVYLFDGTRWTPMVATASQLNAVWGSGPGDVWFMGNALYHWNGTRMETLTAPATGIWSISGTGPKDIWAVGQGGVIVHYDGTTWTTVPSSTTQWLVGVSALSPTNVLVTGYAGTILQFDGTSFRTVTSPTTVNLMSSLRVAGATFITGWTGTMLRNL